MQNKKEKNFWWVDWPIAIVYLLLFAAVLVGTYLLWFSREYEPTLEWYMIVCLGPLLVLVISWIRPLRVKGNRFIIGLDRIPSFRRYAVSVNDIQKIDLWCWPPAYVDASGAFWQWEFRRRYGSPLVIFIWDKNGEKYKNIVTNIALFRGLINKMKEQDIVSSDWIKILPPLLVPSEIDRNIVMPTFITDIAEDLLVHGTVGRSDKKPPIEESIINGKECPHCKKIIPETAIRCKYCRKVMLGKARNE